MTEIHRTPHRRRPLPLKWIDEDGFELNLAIRHRPEEPDVRQAPPLLTSETSFFSPPLP